MAMTENDWLLGEKKQAMLQFIRETASARKLRLFLCAVLRSAAVWPQLTSRSSRRAVEVGERYADGMADRVELKAAQSCAYGAYSRMVMSARYTQERFAYLAQQATWSDSFLRTYAMDWLARMVKHSSLDIPAALFHEVHGNPFAPAAFDPTWRRWGDGTLPRVAQGIYDTGVYDQMPILADALEDAGCTSPLILDHCRGPDEHVRGCWVLDLVLERE